MTEIDLNTLEEIQEDIPEFDPELLKNIANNEFIGFVASEYQTAQDDRRPSETKWLKALRDVRGEYSPQTISLIRKMQETNPYASEAFIKVAKTKSDSATAQLREVLLASTTFPIGIEPSIVPEGTEDIIHLVDEGSPEAELGDVIGFAGDGNELPKGATQNSLLGSLKDLVTNAGKKVAKGPATDPNQVELHPAKRSALALEKQIHDQLTADDALSSLDDMLWELVRLGTGVLKGPLTKERIVHSYSEDANGEIQYTPITKISPTMSAPSVWNSYPIGTGSKKEDLKANIERHLLTKSQLRKWKLDGGFNESAIDRLLEQEPSYELLYWEDELRDADPIEPMNKYEVLEYWGWLDSELARRLGIPFSENKHIQIRGFVCQNEVLKVVSNPLIPQSIPYDYIPYSKQNYQVHGIGLPEDMSDATDLMNAHWRAAIDNLNLSGNVMLEIDTRYMKKGQQLNATPGKIYKKDSGPPGQQAVRSLTLNSTAHEHFAAFDKARQLADEATGMVSFGQGSTSLPSSVRTSSQTSMLLQGSALTIKSVIKNIDKYGLNPLGTRYFHWNMQFNKDLPEIYGDYEVVAKGTASLLQKEVRSQRLITFSQIAGSNPIMAPMVDFEYILQELATTMDLDPDKVTNDPDKAKLIASLMQASGAGSAPQGAGPLPSADAGAQMAGEAGGGTIGEGGVPQPGEQGFTG